MDKYTKHRFFTVLVLEIRALLYSTISDAIFISKFSPVSETHRYAIQHITGLLSKTIRFVKQRRTRLKFSYFIKPKLSVYKRAKNRAFLNRPFPSSKKSLFQSEANCEAIYMKMSFNYNANKTHFHNKGSALSFVLKVRFFGTRKWPIDLKRTTKTTE